MRNKIILYFLLTVTLFSCKAKVYTIKGVAPAMDDSTYVFIADASGKNKIDTTIVKNGAFSFRGKPNDSIFSYIHFSDTRMSSIPIILEAGNIKVEADTAISVTGTPLNNKNTDFQRKLKDLEEDREQYVLDFIDANLNNIVGIDMLKNSLYTTDLDDLKRFSAKIPKKYENNETAIRVRKLIQSLEKTTIGKEFIDIKAFSPEGKEISLSNYVGKTEIVHLHFWASWCPPCRKNMPHLIEAYSKYKDRGLEIVGFSLDREKEDWVRGIKELGISWPQMSDLKLWDSTIAQDYTIQAIPQIILIDKDGIIIYRGIGAEELNDKLSELLK